MRSENFGNFYLDKRNINQVSRLEKIISLNKPILTNYKLKRATK